MIGASLSKQHEKLTPTRDAASLVKPRRCLFNQERKQPFPRGAARFDSQSRNDRRVDGAEVPDARSQIEPMNTRCDLYRRDEPASFGTRSVSDSCTSIRSA